MSPGSDRLDPLNNYEHTTLNELFRHWLAEYVGHHERLQRYDQVISALRGKVRVGRKLTRDEMHER